MSKAGRSARAISSTRIWRRSGSTSKAPGQDKNDAEWEEDMEFGARFAAAGLIAALAFAATPPAAEDVPKRGGTLTYLIPADAPPIFDAHRESTYATVHAAPPVYRLVIRVNTDT